MDDPESNSYADQHCPAPGPPETPHVAADAEKGQSVNKAQEGLQPNELVHLEGTERKPDVIESWSTGPDTGVQEASDSSRSGYAAAKSQETIPQHEDRTEGSGEIERYWVAAYAALGAGFGAVFWSLFVHKETEGNTQSWPLELAGFALAYLFYDRFLEPSLHWLQRGHWPSHHHIDRLERQVLRGAAMFALANAAIHVYVAGILESPRVAFDWLIDCLTCGALTLGWLRGMRQRPSAARVRGATAGYWLAFSLSPVVGSAYILAFTMDRGVVSVSFYHFVIGSIVYLIAVTTLSAYPGGALLDRKYISSPSLNLFAAIALSTAVRLASSPALILFPTYTVRDWTQLTTLYVFIGLGWCAGIAMCIPRLRAAIRIGSVVSNSVIGIETSTLSKWGGWLFISVLPLLFLQSAYWIVLRGKSLAAVAVWLLSLLCALIGCKLLRKRLAPVLKPAVAATVLLGLLFAFMTVERHRPQFLAREILSKGMDLESDGNLDGALSEYQSAVSLNPQSAEAHNSLGSVLYRRGDTDDAIREFGKAVCLDWKFAKAYNNLSVALIGEKNSNSTERKPNH